MTIDAAQLRDRTERWIADDPDDASRKELRALLDGLPGTAGELADRFAGSLEFGTAGLRGPLRAGPNGMNLAVVRRTAAGLVGWLDAQQATGPLVVGFDARHGSYDFAVETARVARAAGRETLLMPRPLPTPVLAYAVRHLGAVAGVMVTASHNPARDNGYKVYVGEALGGVVGAGAQIVPPVDAEIAAAIESVSLPSVPLASSPPAVVAEEVVDAYVAGAAAQCGPGGSRELRVAYTPMHGVGLPVLLAAFDRAGWPAPAVVREQAEPDPDFPTVAFPNPEEPGAMDLLVALAEAEGADIAIANDPDADRCAVAVPPVAGSRGWRMLRGDEVGLLLADHLIRRGRKGLFAASLVSSSALRALCARRGLPYAESLTGFKWIVRTGDDLTYGYEEALGYAVDPSFVRDKDGITAALLVAELVAGLRAELSTVDERLDELAAEIGVHVTDQISIRVTDLAQIADTMRRLRAAPPDTVLDEPVVEVRDLLPGSDVLVLRADGARVVVRPSGTEPKLKAYLEVVEPVDGGDVPAARERASAGLAALRAEVSGILGID